MTSLQITSPSFADGGKIPKRHTGFGEDVSPQLMLHGLDEGVVSLALTMDDLDVPMAPEFNHWVMWNIPRIELIPENIPCGGSVKNLGSAVQGIGFGKNRYAGPKQPFFITARHRYLFRVYALDTLLELPASAGKPELLQAMEGHILQTAELTGTYRRGDD